MLNNPAKIPGCRSVSNDFQNLIGTSFSTDTFVVTFLRRSFQ